MVIKGAPLNLIKTPYKVHHIFRLPFANTTGPGPDVSGFIPHPAPSGNAAAIPMKPKWHYRPVEVMLATKNGGVVISGIAASPSHPKT